MNRLIMGIKILVVLFLVVFVLGNYRAVRTLQKRSLLTLQQQSDSIQKANTNFLLVTKQLNSNTEHLARVVEKKPYWFKDLKTKQVEK